MAGFFGKLPASGDFVARGLGVGMRGALDAFLSQHFAQLVRTPDVWPELGVRAVIHGSEEALLLVIIPSHDTPGRAFPLAGVSELNDASQALADIWADAALPALWAAVDEKHAPDDLAHALAGLPPPQKSADPLAAPQIWADGYGPMVPEAGVQRIFGPVSSD